MFYIIIFLILCCFSYCEYKGINLPRFIFELLFSLITVITILRYGQGTDYFSYMYQYYLTPSLGNVSSVFDINTHGEIGYKILSSSFRAFGISFVVFVGIIGFITMVLIYKFIKGFSKLPITSLTLFYVLFYLVYVLSGIRQGLALAMFVGIALPFYKKKKYFGFILTILFAATIHSSVLITLLIIPLDKLEISYKIYGTIILVGLIIMITNVDIKIINLLPDILSSKVLHYWELKGIPLFALANRLVMLCIILISSHYVNSKAPDIILYKKVYILGFILFILTIKSITISSRISIYMKFLEIILIPNLVFMLKAQGTKFKSLQLWSVSLIIAFVLLLKTLNAFLSEGDYFSNISLFKYPFINVFHRERIWEYREPSKYLDLVKILGKKESIKY